MFNLFDINLFETLRHILGYPPTEPPSPVQPRLPRTASASSSFSLAEGQAEGYKSSADGTSSNYSVSGTPSWSTPEQSLSSNTLLEPAPMIPLHKPAESSSCHTPAPHVRLDIDERTLTVENPKAVLCYKGEQAQHFLNSADKILTESQRNLSSPPAECTSEKDTTLRRNIHRILVRLIQESKELPASLIIGGGIELDRVSDGSYNRIGVGAYAHVYAGRLAGQRVAVKAFLSPDSKHVPFETEQERIRLLGREIAIQRYLDHPNICRPIGVIFDLFDPVQIQAPCIVHPLMEHRSVMHFMATLNNCDQRHKQKTVYRILRQVAAALEYTHESNVVHGDLHGYNILIDENGDARISDFGIANFADSTPASVSLQRMGAARYMAPEILEEMEAASDVVQIHLTPEGDIFSFGMCALQIITNHKPFREISNELKAKKAIMGGRIPACPPEIPAYGDEIWNIMLTCWKHAPGDRPSAKTLTALMQNLEDGV